MTGPSNWLPTLGRPRRRWRDQRACSPKRPQRCRSWSNAWPGGVALLRRSKPPLRRAGPKPATKNSRPMLMNLHGWPPSNRTLSRHLRINQGETVEAIDVRIKRLEAAGRNHQDAVAGLNNEITRLTTLIEANEGAGVE